MLLIASLFGHFSFIMLGAWMLFALKQVAWNVVFVLPVYGLAVFLWYRYCD